MSKKKVEKYKICENCGGRGDLNLGLTICKICKGTGELRQIRFQVCAGRIKVKKFFNSYKEAKDWALWNYKGDRDAFTIIEERKDVKRGRGKGSKFTKEDFYKIKKLEKAGVNDIGIAEITGWSLSTVNIYLSYKQIPTFLIDKSK